MSADGHVAVNDVVAQTKQAFANVRAVIEAGGCAMRDVVRLQTFLTRADDVAGFMKARSEIFPEYFPDGVYPPNTLLVISQLVRPDLLVEIEALAVRRKGRAAPSPRPRKAAARRRARR
jgi:enamine deaminase RidA (YjgF/YER057c/UK114 family)